MAMAATTPRPSCPMSRDTVVSGARGMFSDSALKDLVDRIFGRHRTVGVAVGVIRDGRPTVYLSRGSADLASRTPVTRDTVFRIASITKLFTAVAITQLWEQGLVDLDAPANDYLRAYRLVPAEPGFRPATLRHLLTHTAGIPEVRGLADLLHADLTPAGGRPALLSVRAGEPLPALAEYYRDGLRVVVEPGTAFAYTNHGFATLGQVVVDVTGLSLDRYLRERLFEPLGMSHTDLVRSARVAGRLATGYRLTRRGPRRVADREWVGAGSGGAYSSMADMTRFVTALLGGGAGQQGRILEPASLAAMMAPQFQPDPRLPGVGLGFFRGQVGGSQVVSHDGILPGFNSSLLMAPDDGIGIVAFTNGASGAVTWLDVELDGLLCRLLGVPDEAVTREAPGHPEAWAGLSGRYVFQPRISDLRARLMLSRGAEVAVIGGRLVVRLLTPVPIPRRGLPLRPDDEHDPDVFRLDLSNMGMSRVRVVFTRGPDGRATAAHTDLGGQPWTLVRVDHLRPRRAWLMPALGTAVLAGVIVGNRRRDRRRSAR
jgi:CubicO group peptidase (beta-lactamase class C family)